MTARRPNSQQLRILLEYNRRIKQSGGIGKKTARLPFRRHDVIARTKRKSEELLNQIS